MKHIFIIAGASLFLVGCLPDSKTEARLSELESKVLILEASLERTEETLLELPPNLAYRINDLESEFSEAAYFTPSSSGYQLIQTTIGALPVSLKEVSRYANGYKLVFEVGNPSFTKLSDVTAKLTYNRQRPEKFEHKVYTDWLKNSKTVETKLDKELLAGMWNKVEIIATPAKEDEIGLIVLELHVNQISLSSDRRKW